MATIAAAQVIPVYTSGAADLVALFALRNVSAGDTIDVATLTNFQIVKRGVVMGVSDFVEIAATFAGTVVTMPGGLANSSGYLLIWGC